MEWLIFVDRFISGKVLQKATALKHWIVIDKQSNRNIVSIIITIVIFFQVLDHDLYGLSVDWWGVGIIMYEMLCGQLPFADSTIQGLLTLIKNEDVKFSCILGNDATDLVRSLLRKDPQLRLGCSGLDVQEVQMHPFFRNISWEDVMARKVIVFTTSRML